MHDVCLQAFPATIFRCSLFVVLSAITSVFTNSKVSSVRLSSGDCLVPWRIFHFYALKNSWVAFTVCFGSLSICTVKPCQIGFAGFSWIWGESTALCTLQFIVLLLSAVTSSLNIADTVPHACAITLPPPCLTDDVICFWLWAVSPVLHSFLFPSRSSHFFVVVVDF